MKSWKKMKGWQMTKCDDEEKMKGWHCENSILVYSILFYYILLLTGKKVLNWIDNQKSTLLSSPLLIKEEGKERKGKERKGKEREGN